MKLRTKLFLIAAAAGAVAATAAGGIKIVSARAQNHGNNAQTLRIKYSRLVPVSRNAGEGCLRVMDRDGKPVGECPLKHTSVTADVSGFVARVDVVQEFVNPLDEKIEAVYVFPLPQDCAVDRMEMTVGSRTIRGEIKRKEEARQIYEDAKAAGHVASLLDQERPNIFTQSVANIMPGEKVRIKISYVDLLKYEDGEFEFVFPMVVGPRYIPGAPVGRTGEGWSDDTTQAPDASKITPPVTPEGTRAGHDISVEVDINAGVPIGRIESVLHEVDVDRDGNDSARVSLQDQATIPNKDFILRYQVAGDAVGTGLLPSTRAAGDGYFSLVLAPPKSPKPSQIAPKEMIFVIDSSGSQMGWPIEKAKETMKLCVSKMNPGDTFQMLAFSIDVIPLFECPRPNTLENRALALDFLANRCGNGGTEMMKSIVAALTPPADPKRLRIVCFMTDGYVGNDFEIIDAIKKNIGGARLFSFGIGDSVNRFLLDGMADMGRGAVEYVTLQEQGDKAAERFYDRISKPLLTDISIDWGGLPVDDIYPQRIPDLFSRKPVIINGRYSAGAKGYVTVRGKLGGKPWEQKIAVALPRHTDENAALPSIWARAKIADLTARDYMNIQQGNPDADIKEEVTQVALDYELMSQFTSFVAVEEMVITEGGKPKKVAVPVEMPEGVSYEGVFGSSLTKSKGVGGMMGGTSGRGQVAACAPMASVAVSGRLSSQNSAAGMAGSAMPASPAFERDAKDRLEQSQLTPQERKKRLIESRLDPALRGLESKLDKKGNYSVPGKIEVVDGKVRVSVRLSDDSEANLAKLKALGLKISASAKSVRMVIGFVPVDKLEALAELGFVLRIAPVA